MGHEQGVRLFSKNLMRTAWHRVGVPRDIALGLADIDIDGVTVVKSNYALNAWMINGYESIRTPGTSTKFEGRVDFFLARRGTGQGDVPIPTCWNLVFYILLTMLDRDDSSQRYLRGRDKLVTETEKLHLPTISSTLGKNLDDSSLYTRNGIKECLHQ